MDISIDCNDVSICTRNSDDICVELNDIDTDDILGVLNEFDTSDIIKAVGEEAIRNCLAEDFNDETSEADISNVSIESFISYHGHGDILDEMDTDTVFQSYKPA